MAKIQKKLEQHPVAKLFPVPNAAAFMRKRIFRAGKQKYPVVLFEGKDSSEEEQCAIFIDRMPEVEYWGRNLALREHDSFFLQLYNRKFYLDFVVKLKNGRILVVEYKGIDRYSNDDSKEKRIVSDFWAQNSNSQCLFVMTNGTNLSILKNIVGGKYAN